ncbi:MAG TPA: carboxylating nicotinate-nucleotide diphosphorylase [Actinomycetes bacterium]|nr:carboxylating nicotinate-nucleotide diphosphorylase [Actinomycetes bacterium]
MPLSEATVAGLEAAGLSPSSMADLVKRALDEDLAYGPDATTAATVPTDQRVRAAFASRQPGIVAGLGLVAVTLDVVVGADRWSVVSAATDGQRVERSDVVLALEAPTAGLLTAERTALNFLGHVSGVATLTSKWVDAVSGTKVMVRDTRKTIPGLRVLDKYAVRCGGGVNHRMGLGDAALIKDNHVVAAGGIAQAVAAVRSMFPDLPLEVECDSLEQVKAAVDADVSLVLLDNMSVDQLREAVQWVRSTSKSVQLEASGGLSLGSVRPVAETGVDFVAVGALTHSAPVLDLGLDVLAVV